MVNLVPCISETEQSTSFDQRELADGEVTSDEVGTNMFPILFHTYRYSRFLWRITGATSATAMAAQQRRMVVLQPSPMTAWPGERGYGIYKP